MVVLFEFCVDDCAKYEELNVFGLTERSGIGFIWMYQTLKYCLHLNACSNRTTPLLLGERQFNLIILIYSFPGP